MPGNELPESGSWGGARNQAAPRGPGAGTWAYTLRARIGDRYAYVAHVNAELVTWNRAEAAARPAGIRVTGVADTRDDAVDALSLPAGWIALPAHIAGQIALFDEDEGSEDDERVAPPADPEAG